jgi:hypothetical protein
MVASSARRHGSRLVQRVGVLVGLGSLAACAPDLDDRVSIIRGPQVLAVRSMPAEAPPDTPVTYHALVADPEGESSAPSDFAFCNERKPLAILGPVNPACLEVTSDALEPIGDGPSVDTRLPRGGCRLFGPEIPEGVAGEPPRPFDPDGTGGYYQPVRLYVADGEDDVFAIGKTRLACGLEGATADQRAQYRELYRPNTNPEISAIYRTDRGRREILDSSEEPIAVAPGQVLDLQVEWERCSDRLTRFVEAGGQCTGSEPFAFLNREARRLEQRFEAMSVAWFATGGEFARDRTGRSEADRIPRSDNFWTAPETEGLVHLWIVLRDSRTGVGWQEVRFRVGR